MNLYQISREVEAKTEKLVELLENGETPSDDELNQLLGLQSDLNNKLIAYGYVIKNTEADINAIDEEIKRLTERKKRHSKLVSTLSNNMLTAMLSHGKTEIKDAVMPIKLKNNPPSVSVDCAIDKLPSEFIRTKTTIEADKTSLKEAIKKGLVIDGVRLESKQTIKIG